MRIAFLRCSLAVCNKQLWMQEAGVCMVLLSAQAESFFALAEAAQDLEKQLSHTGILQVC